MDKNSKMKNCKKAEAHKAENNAVNSQKDALKTKKVLDIS